MATPKTGSDNPIPPDGGASRSTPPEYLPTIRLELEGFKQSIMHAMHSYHDDVNESIMEQLQNIIDNFDFGAYVRTEGKRALVELVNRSIQHALDSAMWSEEVQRDLMNAMKTSLTSQINSLQGIADPDETAPHTWTCSCGWRNGCNLDRCARCRRYPDENSVMDEATP